ncbi:MAG: hypothetical protein QF506_03185 [Candidatus Woesearchaeota archaeon]|jgi:hypothetical protein|nr:hypothetical protein [Candidatus Woesearchaeota archaeon]
MEDINEYIDKFFRPYNDGELKLGGVDRDVLNHFLEEHVYKNIDLWDIEGRYRKLYDLFKGVRDEELYEDEFLSADALSGMLDEKGLTDLEELYAESAYVKRQIEKAASIGGVRLVP